MRSLDVAVVGAGAAGIGMAITLARLPGIRYGVLEAGRVGESFRRWPAQTRFITPSFHSTPFGLADLNAVNEASSPALYTGVEHPSGAQYADYLAFLARAHDLPLVEQCRVSAVARAPADGAGGFVLTTAQGKLHARFLVWASGEYQFPDTAAFAGAEHCPHYAQVATWQDFTAPHTTVIGGFESGADAAIQLVKLGRAVRLLVRKASWDPKGTYDPSLSLSPYTRARLYEVVDTGRLDIVFGVDVLAVTRNEHGGNEHGGNEQGGWRIHAADGRYWDDDEPPILGTGFLKGGGAQQIADLWDWDDAGRLILSDLDESTRAPGLFLVGPQVRHAAPAGSPDGARIYCFIYKFRQRFAFVAERIAERLEIDPRALRVGDGAWGPFGNSDCCEGCQC